MHSLNTKKADNPCTMVHLYVLISLFIDLFISYCEADLPENQKVKVLDPRVIHTDLKTSGFKW